MFTFAVEPDHAEIDVVFDEQGRQALIAYLMALDSGDHDHLSTTSAGGDELSDEPVNVEAGFKLSQRVNLRLLNNGVGA